jgi:hypothetical protein
MTKFWLNNFTIDDYIKNALNEDMYYGDITTDSVVASLNDPKFEVILATRSNGVLCGRNVFERVFEIVAGDKVNVEFYFKDGDEIQKGDKVATIKGDARLILMGERLALNFIQKMSGIATYTRKFAKKVEKYDRAMYKIPVMSGDFYIDENFGICDAVAGGNLYIIAKCQQSALTAAISAVNAIKSVPHVITPFPGGIVASGSKVGSNKYSFMHATTNEAYCPSLKDKIDESKLSDDSNGVYEIVFDGLSEKDINIATQKAINAIKTIPDVQVISAGNFGGKLGEYKINLINE